MGNRLRSVMLFIAGCLFTAIISAEQPDTLFGTIARAMALWLAFYPFVSSTNLDTGKYWLMLLVGVPVAVLARNMGEGTMALKWATLGLFIVSVGVFATQRLRRPRI